MFTHDNFPEYIMIHHSDSKDDRNYLNWLDIYRWHVLEKGWSYPGYHYGVEWANERAYIIPGRPEWSRGAHCNTANMNNKSIGICIIGNFSSERPAQELLDKLYELIDDIYKRYGKQLKVVGHKEFNPTSCPGDAFPLDEVKSKSDEIWNSIQDKVITPKKAIEYLATKSLSSGEKVVSMPTLWQSNLLSPNISSESVKWLLIKTVQYMKENGI